MTNLIEDIETDFEAGAYKTYLQLQHFSKKYDGKIPTRGPLQEIILTLGNLLRFYSHHIITFCPTSLNLSHFTPKFLALLISASDYFPKYEENFALFISDSAISDVKRKLYLNYIFVILKANNLKGDTHPSIVRKVFQGESLDLQWWFEAYLKLASYLTAIAQLNIG